MTKISASLRLCVNPFFRHPRVGGGPTPDRVAISAAQVMDSRLRGNDEMGLCEGDVCIVGLVL